jgi:hypothetical protein
MRKIILWLKMWFTYPVICFAYLHSIKATYKEQQSMLKVLATMVVNMTKTKIEVSNTNLIPLEDGYFFISNHQSSYDGLVLINSIPIDVLFYLKTTEKIPYLNLFVKLIGSIKYTDELIDQSNASIKEKLNNKLNVVTYINGLDQKRVDGRILDSSYQNHNAIIPIVIKHSKNMVRKAYSKVELIFCTPLHYEEYGSLSTIECMIEIQKRMDEEIN